MVFGCLLNVVLFVGLYGAYGQLLDVFLDPPANWIVPAIMSIVTILSIGALLNAKNLHREYRVLRNVDNQMPPVDGEWTAIAGKIEAIDKPLIGPFSDRRCVMYEYEIKRHNPKQEVSNDSPKSTPGADFSGMAMAPCVIRNEQTKMQLFGFPELKDYPEKVFDSRAALQRAREYVRETDWEDCSGTKFVGGFSQMWRAITDTQASFKHDWRMTSYCPWLQKKNEPAVDLTDDDDEEDEEDADDSLPAAELETDEETERLILFNEYVPRLMEKRIDVGRPVVAIGIYDSMLGGLASPAKRNTLMMRLYPGKKEEVLKTIRQSRRANFVGGLLAILLSNAILALGMGIYLHSDAAHKDWAERMQKALEKKDYPVVDKLVQRGMSLDSPLNSQGDTTLMLSKSPDVTKELLQRGANPNVTNKDGYTPLMVAVRDKRLDIAQVLIDAKADLDIRNTLYHSTALVLALGSENAEAVQLLRQAGAYDDTVLRKDGTLIEEDHPAYKVVLDYIAAQHAHDLDQMNALSAGDRTHMDSIYDWDALCGAKPKEPKYVNGFERGDDATIRIAGETPTGSYTRWLLQLKRENGQWKIVREQWTILHTLPE